MLGAGVGIGTACVAAALIVWFRELRTPRRISWQPTTINGLSAAVAHGLVLQHDDGIPFGQREASRSTGAEAEVPFERVISLRLELGRAWGGYLASLRSRFGYQELVELLPLADDRLVAFAAGDIHLSTYARADREDAPPSLLRARKGRGLMAFGVTSDQQGAIYFGEYTTEPGSHPVCIWKSNDEGRTWHKAFEFPSRHRPPYPHRPVRPLLAERSGWAPGDRDEQCYVGVSHDGAATFSWIAQGSQKCRTCGFVFFPDVVLWGMDAGHEPNPSDSPAASRRDDRLACRPSGRHVLPSQARREPCSSRSGSPCRRDLGGERRRRCLSMAQLDCSCPTATRAGAWRPTRPRWHGGGGHCRRLRPREPHSYGRVRRGDLPNSAQRRSAPTALTPLPGIGSWSANSSRAGSCACGRRRKRHRGALHSFLRERPVFPFHGPFCSLARVTLPVGVNIRCTPCR